MKERRNIGFCYNCDEKWRLRHKCKIAKLFIMKSEDFSDKEEPIIGKRSMDKGASSAQIEPKIMEA